MKEGYYKLENENDIENLAEQIIDDYNDVSKQFDNGEFDSIEISSIDNIDELAKNCSDDELVEKIMNQTEQDRLIGFAISWIMEDFTDEEILEENSEITQEILQKAHSKIKEAN